MKNIKIFSEKIEGIKIEDIIKLFYSNDSEAITSKENKIFINPESQKAKNLGISKELCDNLYAIKNYATINIKYKEKDIPNFYKRIEIKNSNGEREIQEIYTLKYCEKLIKEEKNFKNPLIVDGKKILEFSELKSIFYGDIESFSIIDREKIDYEKIFSNKDETKIDYIRGFNYSENFNYYFKYPDKNEIFIYNYDQNRSKLIQFGNKEKIKCICGNFGIGKSTSLLAAKLEDNEIIYLNIKALMKNKLDVFTWKYELLLKEIAFSMKHTSDYDTFIKLKKEIIKKNDIWKSIIKLVKFMKKNKIKAKIILDQYKQKYDLKYENIIEIISLINKNKYNNVKLIISSSINNKDVRNSLLSKWFPEFDIKISFYLNYVYFDILFDSTSLIENDNSLSDKKKEYIKKYFNNIPRFYYDIKYINDKNLDEYIKFQLDKILEKIKLFYIEDIDQAFIYQYFRILSNNRQKIGRILEDEKLLFDLLSILPLKYFTLKNKTINFYFSLVEKAFDQYLADKICLFLKSPLNDFNAGFIGDLLEYVLLNDLKNKKFDNFDETIIVETIWDLKIGENLNNINIKDIEKKDILILQSEPKAKYLDFAILSKSNTLILFQCKKALAKEPNNYITTAIINENKFKMYTYFEEKLKAKIEKIYLIYITGASLVYDEKNNNQKLIPWGNKKSETFKINEKICKKSDCKLIYYLPDKKKIYLNIDDNSNIAQIKSLVEFSKSLNEINVGDFNNKNDDDRYNKEFNQWLLDSISLYQENLNKIQKIDKNERKNNNFFDQSEKALLIKDRIPVNPEPFGILNAPTSSDFFWPNICIGYKRKGSKIFTYEDKNKKRRFLEIKNSLLNEKKIEELFEEKESTYDKFYCMSLKDK